MTIRSCANCVEEVADWKWTIVRGRSVRLCSRCRGFFALTNSLPDFYHPVEKKPHKSAEKPNLEQIEKKMR